MSGIKLQKPSLKATLFNRDDYTKIVSDTPYFAYLLADIFYAPDKYNCHSKQDYYSSYKFAKIAVFYGAENDILSSANKLMTRIEPILYKKFKVAESLVKTKNYIKHNKGLNELKKLADAKYEPAESALVVTSQSIPDNLLILIPENVADYYKYRNIKNDAKAMLRFGVAFYYGVCGEKQDFDKAYSYLLSALKLSNKISEIHKWSSILLSNYYYSGLGNKKQNYKKLIKYCIEAANSVETKNSKELYYKVIASLYKQGGPGLTRNSKKASQWEAIYNYNKLR